MLLNMRPGTRMASRSEERIALEKGIAEARASMEAAGGSAASDLHATLTAFIAQAERRIAELSPRAGR
jgi:hypothetical protein